MCNYWRDTLNEPDLAIIPMPAENTRPTVLCFAGLDPSGGAGLQADIETIAFHGGHALPIATCLTVQNSVAAHSFEAVDEHIIEQQFYTLIEDIKISACKISVIPNRAIALCIAKLVQTLPNIPIIYDPVFAATNGSQFAESDTIEDIKANLLPHISVLTPNAKEINLLLNEVVTHTNQASKLCALGPEFILATNADSNTEQVHNSLLSNKGLLENYTYPRLAHHYHGSGCTLSAALAFMLTQNFTIQQAAKYAQDYTYCALQNAQSIGQGQWIPMRIYKN